MLKKALLALTALVSSLGMVSTAVAQDYDLVINNGRVMDPEIMPDNV